MVTKQRPVIGPMRSSAFAYVRGEFYWSLDGVHSEISQYLQKYGFSTQELEQGAWGRVINWSRSKEPEYEIDWMSDYFQSDPQAMAEAEPKLQAYFPDATEGKPQSDVGPIHGKVVNLESAPEEEHEQQSRQPWMYEPALDSLFVGSSGSGHTTLMREIFNIYEDGKNGVWIGESWYGVYIPARNEVVIHGNYDVDYFSQAEIDPGLIAELQGAWPGATIEYPNEDGDMVLYKTAHWTIARFSATIPGMTALNLIQSLVDSDQAAKTAYQALSNAGGTVYVVGGAVRDAVLGNTPKDVDLMVGGLNDDQIQAALSPLGRLDFTGKQFGVYRFKTGGDEVEIALPRTEQSTGDGHKDFEITADPYLDPSEDLARRDFTGNAMAYNPASGELLDPHGGADDLQNGRLRLVNDKAFEDDPLRIVRALVSESRFGLTPDPQVIQSMKDNAQAIRHLPGERIQMEMDKLLAGKDPATAIATAFSTGLVDYIAPELSAMQGFDQQNVHHDLPVDEHTLAVLRKISTLTNDPDVRLAALFHDSGKPESFWKDPASPDGEGGHFYKKINDDGTELGDNHQDVSARLARAYMERMRYPTARIDHVVNLVQNHMFAPFNSKAGARRFISKFGGDLKTTFDMLNLREADSSGKSTGNMSDADTKIMHHMRELVQSVVDEGNAFTVKDLAINGKDLIALGYKPGPEIGVVLKDLLDKVIEDPTLNTKETLESIVSGA